MDADKDKYIDNGSIATNNFGDSGNFSAIGANKDEYTGSGFSAANNSSSIDDADIAGVDKNKDIDSSFGNVATDEVGKNAGKRLKISKFKVIIAIINSKKFYLLKKTMVTKFF